MAPIRVDADSLFQDVAGRNSTTDGSLMRCAEPTIVCQALGLVAQAQTDSGSVYVAVRLGPFGLVCSRVARR
jgi:hypothetical protein